MTTEAEKCHLSPTGVHSESWYGNGDCAYCKTGAVNKPLYWHDTAKDQAMTREAKRLASAFDTGDYSMRDIKAAAALLRQQSAEIERLKEALAAARVQTIKDVVQVLIGQLSDLAHADHTWNMATKNCIRHIEAVIGGQQ